MKESYRESEKFGSIRELMASQIFIKKGYNVALPIVKTRYDMIVISGLEYFRIQVKPLKIDDNNNLKISAYSTQNKVKKTYNKSEIDFVMAIHIETGKYVLIPIENISEKTGVVEFKEGGTSNYNKYLNWFINNSDMPKP